MKLGDALEKRGVAPHIYESAADAPSQSKPLPIDYEQCCSDRLNPQPKADIPIAAMNVCLLG